MDRWPAQRGPRRGVRQPPLLPRRLASNLALRRDLSQGRYDLVVGFDLDGFALPRRRGTRRVACLKGVAADEARFESGTARLRLLLQARLERRAARRAHRVLVPSRYSRHRAAELYGLPRGRVRVVPEGVHAAEWEAGGTGSGVVSTAPADPPPGRPAAPSILSVARQYRRKNTGDLLRAMPHLLDRHPGTRLRVVGGGPELPALHRLRAELGLRASVELLGEIPARAEVLREYRSADAFCLPSLQEGFGIAFLEAMSAGLPVVACRAGAVPEVVEHGVTGLLCAPGRPGALARALATLLADPDRRRDMGQAGRLRARRYAWPRVARIFLRMATARCDEGGV